MTLYVQPGRVVDRTPDPRTYADGWRAAKADSAFLLGIGADLLRSRLDTHGVECLDALLTMHAEDKNGPRA